MKTLLSTTALVVALGFPAITFAQDTAPAANPAVSQQGTVSSAFLDMRHPSDLLASEIIGHDVHARRPSDDAAEAGDAERTLMISSEGLEEMENIGQINEIVLSQDGQVRAFVIGVGGFLGMGDHDVAIAMDEVMFAANADDPTQVYIVVDTSAEMLKTAPAFDSTVDARAEDTGATPASFAAPDMTRDGYARVDGSAISTEMLMGKDVFDAGDNKVGTVTDMVMDAAGTSADVIVDFGGFLGIGKTSVGIGYDELTFLVNDEDDVRMYVDATKDQIRSRQARATN